jgi:very-short-patch-repair endonuclease
VYLWDELSSMGGVARRADLVHLPAHRRQLAEALREGYIMNLGAGWVALAEAHPAIVKARRLNATITCVSAAEFHQLATLQAASAIHLAVPRARGSRRRRSRPTEQTEIHRETGWTRPADPRWPVAPVPDVLTRALRCQPAEQAIAMVDSALNKSLITLVEVERALVGPGSPAALATLRRCNARSRSAIETLARLVLVDAGLDVRVGEVIEGVGEVDLLVEDCVVVECDGYSYHSDQREFREDRRRDRELVARGYVVLRFTWADIMRDPGLVVTEVLRALARIRHPGA